MAASPLQPFLVTVTRCSQPAQLTQETDGQIHDLDDIDTEEGSDLRAGQHGACLEPAPAVQLSFQADAGATNGEQLADIIKVVVARVGRSWHNLHRQATTVSVATVCMVRAAARHGITADYAKLTRQMES